MAAPQRPGSPDAPGGGGGMFGSVKQYLHPYGEGYDREGNLLPTGGDVVDLSVGGMDPSRFRSVDSFWSMQKDTAFDPNMGPPEPDSKNPYPPADPQYQWWKNMQEVKAENQRRKAVWQQNNAGAKKGAVAPTPAKPFQSSGIDLTKQGKGESYIDSILSHYEKEGAPQTSNYSEQALADFNAQQPKDMSAYYDNASRKAQNAINTQMAARGSYGSSNAMGNLMAAETDLRAQQARDEAGYGLSRFGMQNTLSGAADSQNNNRSANELLWAKGLSGLATDAQGLGENRNQALWGNNLALAGMKAGVYGSGANAAIDDVTDANDAANNATMGVANDAQSNAAGAANRAAATNASVINGGVTAAANTYNYYKKPGSS